MSSAGIDDLTDEQALNAVNHLFEQLGPDAWDGPRPTWEDVESWREDLEDAQLDEQTREVVDVLTTGTAGEKAALTRQLLHRAADRTELRPLVERAVGRAAKPHLAPPPLLIGILVLILASSVTVTLDEEVKFRQDGVTVQSRKRHFKLVFKPGRAKEVASAAVKWITG